MRSKASTFKVLFYLRRNRLLKDGTCAVMIRITLSGDVVAFNSKITVNPDHWDVAKSRLKLAAKGAREINQTLDEMQASLFNHYRELERMDSAVTAEKIRNAFLGFDEREDTLLTLFSRYLNNAQKLQGISKSKATIQKYERCFRRLFDFMKKTYHVSDILLKDMKYEFIVDFEAYLRRDCGCCNNTAAKFVQTLRMIIIYAKNNGLIFADPFTNYKIRLETVDRGFLTMEELNIIADKEITIKRMAQVRDVFLFSCFTGLAYIDVFNLRKEHIKEGPDGKLWIMTHRQKTNTRVNVPLLSIPLEILKKYEGKLKDDKVLPVMSNQRLNSYLKELADICGINKRITFHLARHTFATTITLANGMPMETVSKLLGHTQIKTTQIYARITNEKLRKDMATLSSQLDTMNLPEIQG